MKRIALFSLSDTSGADEFAERLISAGWDILASAETVATLARKGLPVQDIADFTGVRNDYGFPPTLHAKVEYALTANDQPRIDLVYVRPYALSIGNDVGGRTLLALAVKGGRIAVMGRDDMREVVAAICEAGDVPRALRLALADKASYETANHYFSLVADRDRYDCVAGRHSYALKSGENPYQVPAAAFAVEGDADPLSLLKFRRVSGEAPCFTNVADADSILRTMCLAAGSFGINGLTMPYLCLAAKHGNACGMGASFKSPSAAVEKALFGNARSIWGGEVIVNFPVDEDIARALFKSERRQAMFGDAAWMLDVIMAPVFTPQAISILGNRQGRKLFENPALQSPHVREAGLEYRSVRGGFLRQPVPSYLLHLRECLVEGRDLTQEEMSSLIVAWAVAFSSSHGGNEIALAKEGSLLGVGGGPSTVEAAQVALRRAEDCGHLVKGSAFAADAFFPFADAPTMLCKAGVAFGCVPGGGAREGDVKQAFRAGGVTVAYLPKEIRGFCRH